MISIVNKQVFIAVSLLNRSSLQNTRCDCGEDNDCGSSVTLEQEVSGRIEIDISERATNDT